jgi:hypothetical protein
MAGTCSSYSGLWRFGERNLAGPKFNSTLPYLGIEAVDSAINLKPAATELASSGDCYGELHFSCSVRPPHSGSCLS